jgi:hypothetical protein
MNSNNLDRNEGSSIGGKEDVTHLKTRAVSPSGTGRIHDSKDFKFIIAHNGDESAEEEVDDLLEELESN